MGDPSDCTNLCIKRKQPLCSVRRQREGAAIGMAGNRQAARKTKAARSPMRQTIAEAPGHTEYFLRRCNSPGQPAKRPERCGQMVNPPTAAFSLGQNLSFLTPGQHPAKIQRHIKRLFQNDGGGISHILPDAVPIKAWINRCEDFPDRFAVQYPPALKNNRKMGGQIGVIAAHTPDIGRRIIPISLQVHL